MVWILNKSERAYNIGGVLVSPLVPIQIDDSFLDNARVKEIMADGDIETTSAPSESNETETVAVAEPEPKHVAEPEPKPEPKQEQPPTSKYKRDSSVTSATKD